MPRCSATTAKGSRCKNPTQEGREVCGVHRDGAKKAQKPGSYRANRRARASGKFLEALEGLGTVTSAARAAGIGRTTAYDWRRDDEEFAAAWDDALEGKADELEESVYQRALAGDTRAAIFMLRAMRPEKYRERRDLRMNADVALSGVLESPGMIDPKDWPEEAREVDGNDPKGLEA